MNNCARSLDTCVVQSHPVEEAKETKELHVTAAPKEEEGLVYKDVLSRILKDISLIKGLN